MNNPIASSAGEVSITGGLNGKDKVEHVDNKIGAEDDAKQPERQDLK